MMSASDRRYLAFPGVAYPPGSRPDCSGRGLDRPREWFSGSGTDPDTPYGPSCPPQARVGASVFCRRDGVCENGCRPGGWLCTASLAARQRSPDGLRLLARPGARYARSQKAFPPPGPTRSGAIRQREWTQYGMGADGGDEKGTNLRAMLRRAPSPPWGGESKIMSLASAKS